ncbi:MerR family transcriptional regulator [Thermaurantiacus sp.]
MADEAPARTGKSPLAMRTISEVSEALGVPQHILRFWETRFPELRPLKRGGNRRYYRPEDVALCAALKRLLHEEGYTVKGVRRLLATGGTKALLSPPAALSLTPGPAAGAPPPLPSEVRARLVRIRERLAAALEVASRVM